MAFAKADKPLRHFKTVTPETISSIISKIKRGWPNRQAALSSGISERHLYNLIAQGVVDLEYGNFDTLQAKMVQSLANFEGDEIEKCKNQIILNEKGHKGAEWVLEHYYWRVFSKEANIKEISEDIQALRAEQMEGAKNGQAKRSEKEKDSKK